MDEQISDDFVILNFELSDDDFTELCADNRELLFETTAQKELIIMSPPGPRTGRKNSILCTDLEIWARRDGRGITFSPNTIFKLRNGARRGPDASWLTNEQWNALTPDQQDRLAALCPEFVVELMSVSDKRPFRFRMVQAKMQEWIDNGVQLGWLIDPYKKRVYVYRPRRPVELLENPATVSGEPVLPGFVFQIAQLWNS
jgi:Uma2 family endonuclease